MFLECKSNYPKFDYLTKFVGKISTFITGNRYIKKIYSMKNLMV